MCIRDRNYTDVEIETSEEDASAQAVKELKRYGEDDLMQYFDGSESIPVSYTHLDVYKRQG